MARTWRFFPKTSFSSCLLAYLVLFLGCSGNKELLETSLPQSYFLPNPPTMVWKALLHEASKPTRQILVNDEASHLLSWICDVEPDERLHGSLIDPDLASRKGDKMAIAVVRVEGSLGGSKLTIRLTYYSDKPFLGVSPSRGNYEQEILRAVRSSLISEAASHVKS